MKKDISVINLNENYSNKIYNTEEKIKSESVSVFEGFIDALSFVEMQKSYKGNLLVMNSIALLNKTKEHLKDYSEINLFLDNDPAGMKCKNEILSVFPEAKNYSRIYTNHKDLNEYLTERIKTEKQNHHKKEQDDSPKQKQEQQTYQGYKRRR